MADKISYSDGCFLQALIEGLKEQKLDSAARERSVRWLDARASRIRRRANGYWKLPPGKEEFVLFLESIRELFRIGTSEQVVTKCLEDYIQVLNKVSSQCKVAILVQEKNIWPSMESVYAAMEADDRFEVRLVYVPFSHMNKTAENGLRPYLDDGLPALSHTEYDLSGENPDVVIFSKPYDGVPPQFYIGEVEKIIERTVYIPYGMELNYDLIYYGFQNYLHYRAWRHVGYGPLMKQVGTQCGFRNGENIAVWGHPKADQHQPDRKYSIPEEWKKKIRGRRVLLWCPHHTIVPGPECVSTWLDFSETIFALAEKHKDIVLLWRPHPLLMGALVNNRYMTQEELDRFVAEKTAMDNVILDRSEDYRVSFAASDGMISDGTTFSFEYLYTKKPLMLTTKKPESFYNGEALKKGLYIGENAKEIAAFMDGFAAGQDPKRQARDNLRRELFFLPQGKSVGQNIADNIIADIRREETTCARELICNERKKKTTSNKSEK